MATQHENNNAKLPCFMCIPRFCVSANTCPVTCDLDATCVEAGGEFECRCNQGYSGDGAMCTGKTYNGDMYSISGTLDITGIQPFSIFDIL